MKKQLAILLAAALLPLAGCSSKGETVSPIIDDLPDTVSTEEADLPENQAVYRRTSYQYQDGELTCKYYNDFDEHDNIVRSEKNGDPENLSATDVYSYVYNENGNVTEKTTCYINPPSKNKNYSFYDRYYYYPDGALEYRVNYVFDHDSELLQKNYIREFDSHGNEILYLSYNADGSIYYRSENKCEYDDDGNLVKITWQDDETSQVTEYTYDEAGNMLTEVRTETSEESGESSVYTTEYSYDSKGNLIKKTSIDSYDKTDSTEYGYDDKGRLISKDIVDSQTYDNSVYSYRYEYEEIN